MSCKVKKWKNTFFSQERNFLITNTNIYNFNKKSKSKLLIIHFLQINIEFRRMIGIETLDGITKNLQGGSNEFVIHV